MAIARALVLEPQALLIDEPLASVDVDLRRDLLSLFVRALALDFETRGPIVGITDGTAERRT